MKSIVILASVVVAMGCQQQPKPKAVESTSLDYGEIGMEYASSTKAILGKNLVGTIKEKGTVAALEFCNFRAYPLTDSMALVHNAMIKRVSDKPRNPNNQASKEELQYLEGFKKQLMSGEEISPLVNTESEQVHFYYPIITNGMCLQCHGKMDEQIKPEVASRIDALYPDDKAKGYDVNQVRGMWSIVFDKNPPD